MPIITLISHKHIVSSNAEIRNLLYSLSLLLKILDQLQQLTPRLLLQLFLRRSEHLLQNRLQQRRQLPHDRIVGLVCISQSHQCRLRKSKTENSQSLTIIPYTGVFSSKSSLSGNNSTNFGSTSCSGILSGCLPV